MKITAQKVFIANVQRTNFVFVKLYTDAGIEGVGEATLEWKTKTVVAALEELERVLVGCDPFAVDAIIERLHRDSYWRTGAVFRTALGGIEAALLDIKGKALGVPVFELLGGKFRDRVECYANHWFFGATTPEEYAANARKAVAMGYRALKWDPFDIADLEMDRRQRRQTIEIVEAVRDAVGPDIALMLDVHGRLNVPTAIAMCRALAPYDLTWIEEPTPPESIDALAQVRAASPVPIAAGERWYEPGKFLEALTKKAVDILQPDVSHAGGMAETKRVAHLAHTHLIPVAPHNPVGPVMNAMTLHAAVAMPNFSVFETVSIDVPWRKELVRETLRFEDGAILAPAGPGLGVELIEEACERFPYQPTNVPLFDGSMNTSGVATGARTFAGKEEGSGSL
ncbi:mandelate racemase/muconate lactonizing enzyme family protein [Sinorhizobium meliloti]|uniref:mandelate racemase/muconate lactonizing enzyme family protein n=1 Tax=Rhizobium meliloti TaxID=382 RepID=UPI001295DA3C|nr:mandelate racemase/muconate lactonizing enzyme family protein [Sinorhizobium meliloti]MQW59685.1 mandelate racemase [Sinorhizobium meliloti]